MQPQVFGQGGGGVTDAKPVLVLDMGCATTNVLIMHGERTVFARSIEQGGLHLDDAICHQLRCTMVEAREIRRNLKALVPEHAAASTGVGSSGLAGMPPPPAMEEGDEGHEEVVSSGRARPVGPQVDLSEPLEILTDEISMCLRYHRSLFQGVAIDRVVFVGGLSRQVAICEHVARKLNMSAQSVDPLARLGRSGKIPTSGVDLAEAQPGWATVVGALLIPTDL